jgi:ubiquinone/menaquinone biosynthesis C-methylase UbiE
MGWYSRNTDYREVTIMDQPKHEVSPRAADVDTLRQFIMGFRLTQLIYVAAKLGLADQLQAQPQSAYRLAETVGADPHALYRLLRALASVGIFAEQSDGTFTLTPYARLLQTDAPGSLHSVALLYGEEWLWQAYGHMLSSVQTGRPAFQQVHGESLFEYLHHHPLAATVFHNAMTGFSAHETAAILSAYDFSSAQRVVDVGGGQGTLLAAILQAHPHLSGILFDLAPVLNQGQSLIHDQGLSERCSCVAGDFFAAVPAGGDIYLLKSVLHNWDDVASVTILRNCRRVMGEHGRLVLAERVIPSGNTPAEAKLFDINMLVVLGGQERTQEEYRALFEAAELRLTRVLPTGTALSLVEGVPITAA